MKALLNHFIICLLASTFACGKMGDDCGERKDRYYNLNSDTKRKIPHTGTDTLVFVSNAGDTARCIGQGTQVTYETVLTGTHCTSPPKYEVNTTLYTDDNPENNIQKTHTNESYDSNLTFKFKSQVYYIKASQIGYELRSDFRSEYAIGNKTYKNVILLESQSSKDHILVFNSTDGILQIVNGTNEIWNRP